eukprot:10452941-Lingulodinium_polyedra.AAC.1
MYPPCELPSGREAHPASRHAAKRTRSAGGANLSSTSMRACAFRMICWAPVIEARATPAPE